MEQLERRQATTTTDREQSRRLLCLRNGDMKIVEVRDLDTGETLIDRKDKKPALPLPLCSFSIVMGEWRDL